MMKKILAFLIAFALLFSVSINVFADGTPAQFDPQTAEKQDPIDPAKMNDNNVLNHTYRVYQVFTGTLAEDGETLGNIEWGNGVVCGTCGQRGSLVDNLYDDDFFGSQSTTADPTGHNIFQRAIEALDTTGMSTGDWEKAVAPIIAEVVSGFGDYSEAATEFARDVSKSLSDKYYTLNDDGKINFGTDTPKPGYYVIIDKYNTLNDNPEEVKNLALLRIVDPTEKVTIEPKVDVPVISKKVLDTNDSKNLLRIKDIELTTEELAACAGDEDAIEIKKWEKWFKTEGSEIIGTGSENTIEDIYDGWKDSADYDIGDHVPFLITYKLGKISSFPTYNLFIRDEPDAGFTFDKNPVFKVDGVVCENLFPGISYKGGVMVCQNTDINPKTTTLIHDYSVITIEFTMTLTENAVIGYKGNLNYVYATFPNDPNIIVQSQQTQSETPWITATVFTYQLEINKVDEDGEPLDGAKFELFKKVRLTDGTGQVEGTDWEWVSLGEKEPTEVKDSSNAVTAYTFNWKRIDDGDYKLVETETPAGYNPGDDLLFTVNSEHEKEKEGSRAQLTKLEVTGEDAEAFTVVKDSDGKYTCIITTDVENQKGSVLPETGGIGTTIFYVAGGILVAVAGVLLITKKRIGNGPED